MEKKKTKEKMSTLNERPSDEPSETTRASTFFCFENEFFFLLSTSNFSLLSSIERKGVGFCFR